MELKRMVSELLHEGRDDELRRLVATDPRSVRMLLGRLWDADAVVRRHAANALGEAAVVDPELGKEILRRLAWALNDESGTNGAPGLAAIGEIGRRVPKLVVPHLGALVAMAWDEGLRLELLRALNAIAETDPSLIRPYLAEIEVELESANETEHAAFAAIEELCTRGGSR